MKTRNLSAQVKVRLAPAVKAELEQVATVECLDVSDVIRKALHQFLREEAGRRAGNGNGRGGRLGLGRTRRASLAGVGRNR